MSEPEKKVKVEVTSASGEPIDTSAQAKPQQQAPPVDVASLSNPCMYCKQAEIEYKSSTCGHALYCKKCAMKCATGGKCKVCGTMFPDLRRL